MSTKYSTTKTLVIVESPAKCKKIEEYLGPGYKCVASYGHLRELSSLKNIDIENNFNPTYTIINNTIKKKQIEVLRKEIRHADDIILATDDDREGEAISWHICQLYNLDIEKTKRLIFHEITETAMQKAIHTLRKIDMNTVYSQQARQILDILVGYKISPILWKCIAQPNGKENALSAGRCQTPALRLIYDNYREIKETDENTIYDTVGYFTNSNIAFDLNKQFETQKEVHDFLEGSATYNHIYSCSNPTKSVRKQPDPFTTSTLQQTASNELHYSPKETMRICQALYEGGYITYMRTDSKTYSGEFIETVKKYITQEYVDGEKYIHENLNSITSGSKEPKKTENEPKLCQEAHEAIRPTDISLRELKEILDSKERRLYKLIWTNTLESCMCPAIFNTIRASISAFKDAKFTHTTEQIDFPGWKIVSKKYSNENKEYLYLQNMKQNAIIPYKKICSRINIKGLKHHYTEARLVQLLEEKGIGRPSTFSSLVDKIQERGYVKKNDVNGKEILCNDVELDSNGIIQTVTTKREFGKEKSKLIIQPLGIIVIEFLDKYFHDLLNYDYTKNMEDLLDKIAHNQLEWQQLCKLCNEEIENVINSLDANLKVEFKIDDTNTYIIGKYGPVIKCVEETNGKEEIKFKPVNKDIDVSLLAKGEYSLEDVVDSNKKTNSHFILGQYEGYDVIIKKGKYGIYATWGNNNKTLKELGNRPIENITFDEVKNILNEGSNLIRVINKDLSIRRGPKGNYLFYKNSKMKKPSFHEINIFKNETKENYETCDVNILKLWIKNKYNIQV